MSHNVVRVLWSLLLLNLPKAGEAALGLRQTHVDFDGLRRKPIVSAIHC